MDRQREICEWFRKLGYDGDFPENLDRICGNATSFIWDHLLQNTKSKLEVNNMKNNILVSRLNSGFPRKKGEFQYPMEEIKLYEKKSRLEKELANLTYSLTDKQKTNSKLIQHNKIKRFSIEIINSKINEIEEKEYLLREKLKILEMDCQDATKICNFPIVTDLGDEEQSKDITQNLKTFKEKLQRDIKQLPPLSIKNTSNETINHFLFSSRETPRKQNVFENYLTLTDTKPARNDRKRFENISTMSLGKSASVCTYQETYELTIKKIYCDPISKDVKNLLYKYNRQSIWNLFQVLDDSLHCNVSKKVLYPIQFLRAQKNKSDDIAELQALHIVTEFKSLKYNIIFKQLKERFNKKKESIENVISKNSGYPNDVVKNLQKTLELQIKSIGLDSLIGEIKRQIETIQNSVQVVDASEIKKKSMEFNNTIASKRNSVAQYLDIIHEIFEIVNRTRCSTLSRVRKLEPICSDLSWCSLLTDNVNSNEISVFEDFPLAYNKRYINTNPSKYYRDMDVVRRHVELDNESLNMLVNILDSPFSAPETFLLNILRSKCKLESLKSIKLAEEENHKKHTLKDLEEQESYINYVLEKFNSMIASPFSKKTLSASDTTKKIMELWIEMPFKEFISPNRTCEDKDYKYYEKLFDFYNS